MFTLKLNLRKPNNYAFFCPVSKVHLTVSNPVGFANEVTPAILKAVKANTVIDVDGVINLKTGSVNAKKEPVATNPTTPANETAPKSEPVASQPEPTESKEAEVPANESVDTAAEESKTTSKKSKKTKATE